MLTYWQVLALKITYKPDVELRFELDPYKSNDLVRITLSRQALDVHNPSHPTTVVFHDMVDLREHDVNSFLHYMQTCFHRFELHEADEWFKIDGRQYRDPHDNAPPVKFSIPVDIADPEYYKYEIQKQKEFYEREEKRYSRYAHDVGPQIGDQPRDPGKRPRKISR